jgi:hypothetical protein
MAEDTKAGRKKPVVQYYVDGHPQNFFGNKLSSIAYFHTAGISRKTPDRIPSKDFAALLVKLGAEDPRGRAFKVELPNGKVISAKVGKLEVEVPSGATTKRAAKPAARGKTQKQAQGVKRAAPAKAPATPKAPVVTSETRKLAQDQRRALDAWKAAGEKGARPDTKAFDAVTAARVAGNATKGAKKAATVRGVAPSNVGKGAKRPAAVAAKKTS